MNERFGSGVVTDVLKGSKTERIRTWGFDKLSTYGIMKDYSKDTIKDLIYYLITEGYIKCIGDKYPILSLDISANDVLFNGKKIFIKKKIEKIETKSKNTTSLLPNCDENLFEILRNLRKTIAEANNVPPFVVFADSSLRQMSTFYPTDAESMLQIEGVGLNKLVKYGNDFIEAISKYVTENNISVSHIEKKSEKPQKEKVKKEDTRLVSYNLYVNGMSIDEIAKERGFTRVTIENHLINCLENGMEFNLEKDIHTEFKDEIIKAIQDIGTEKLRPIKDALGEKVSYLDIRYYICKLKVSR
jgi:ATP-dependent DNA helicase RecQ